MPRKFIDKKKAATFHLVHRSHRDPLINDPDSSSRVLKYVPPSNSKAPIPRSALEQAVDVTAVRENEGEAAEYGIFFDDTEYDYMQHLRSVGEVPDGILLEAPKGKDGHGKGKGKEVVFGEKLGLPKEVLPGEEVGGYKLESMQNIPDSLRGFQPDMNPDLREVLEALEDELPEPLPPTATAEQSAEVPDDDGDEDPEDIFAQLVQSGELKPQDHDYQDSDSEGYASDDTIKAGIQGSEYLKEMAQWKTPAASAAAAKSENPHADEVDSMVGGGETESMFSKTSNANTHRTSKQRRKRRQRLGGAYSEAGTDYSMTSSANYRNEGLSTLDDRFDKILETYNEDDEASVVSERPPVRPQFKENKQFDAIMDEFLGGYKILGKKMVKKSANGVSGMSELDDVRRELGKARIS